MAAKPLMAQAVADAIGATLRQVQIWTDAGVLQCIAETDRQGRGRQRLYDQEVIPIAALIAAAAQFKLPIGALMVISFAIRHLLYRTPADDPVAAKVRGEYTSKWYQSALRGEIDSFIYISPETPNTSIIVSWHDKDLIDKMLEGDKCAILINVRNIIKRLP